ncbi:TPA: hypothetical protein K8N54_004033 [Serratia marcescens]|uniref:hypothetical protein n=1 Tax=Serratia marcescens TaxID=615 RepID=UPI001C74B682|nr:hypothetical protein [Serratia marcescens]BCZ43649.1 hypothetical protein SMGES_49750 [Serratia marcescens]HBI6268839.1 hypothetical protein [Serratia marcescens]HBI6949463.1 hypothetical protein [Serratia marcescens]HBI6959705.1 hypothetical protein [Serratia marcescens]
MSNYPEYVPEDFIRYFEFEFISSEEKEVASKIIFDERMAFSWSALDKRANECKVPYFFYQSLVMTISEALKGPSDWDLLTHKEKEAKVQKISRLASQLSKEIEGTPLDGLITEYFNHEFYINWFKEHNQDELSHKRMDFHLERFCEKQGKFYISKDEQCLGVSSAWSAVGLASPSVGSMLNELHLKSDEFESISIIKRKSNPKKSFFVRRISAFFEESFGSKLYALTASIASLFLEEELTQEDVVSITK